MNDQPRFCQSCSMPMVDETVYGTEAGGRHNHDYCMYCYQDGAFTAELQLGDMIRTCVPHMVEAHPGMTAESAETMLREYLPKLKRWAGK